MGMTKAHPSAQVKDWIFSDSSVEIALEHTPFGHPNVALCCATCAEQVGVDPSDLLEATLEILTLTGNVDLAVELFEAVVRHPVRNP